MRRELSCNAPESATSYKKSFQEAIKNLVEGGATSLRKSQVRYKRNFDKRVKLISTAVTGDWVYITREQPNRDGCGIARRHKLQAKPKVYTVFLLMRTTQ